MDGAIDEKAGPQAITEEVKAQVFALWNAGKSAGQIAVMLHLTSRNTVIGMVNRARAKGMDLRFTSHNARANSGPKPKAEKKAVTLVPFAAVDAVKPVAVKPAEKVIKLPLRRALPKPDLPASSREWVPLLHTAHRSCRFERDSLFCNAPVPDVGPMWCDQHRRRVYARRK
jgi:hypothetical protein